MREIKALYDSGYVHAGIELYCNMGESPTTIREQRIELINQLLLSAINSTPESYTCHALELLKSIYDDAYCYPNLCLPLGDVHSKIQIYCYTHDIVVITSFYNHVVPSRGDVRLATECPRCIIDANDFY